jgi:glucokinase
MKGRALVADIGGTNARFALASPQADGALRIESIRVYRAAKLPSVTEAVAAYLKSVDARPTAACFAVAGPVTDAVVEFTNSPWALDIAELRRRFGFAPLIAVNDFAALAAGVRLAAPADFLTVKAGASDPSAPRLVVGPGTGFGQALIVRCGDGERIIATEGGHVGFAPSDEEEVLVLRRLARAHGRVSVERVLSGPGLVNLYRALVELRGEAPRFDHADDVAAAAAAGGTAERALAMFFAILGSAVGDAALATGARRGVVLAGGILPKLKEALLASRFCARFGDKGRMSDYVRDIPVDLLIGDGIALLGAATILRDAVP